MKWIVMIALVVGLTTAATCPALAQQQTGLAALDTLARARGPALGNQVVVLTGANGAEQPEVWRLVARDPAFAGRFLAYQIRGGRLISEHAIPAAEAGRYGSAPLARTKLKIDSQVVFWRAHTEAKKVMVGFDSVDYELRNAEFSTTPVWVVSLTRRGGVKVGEIAVSAESGNVLRRSWFEAARPQPASPRGEPGAAPRSAPSTTLNEKAHQAWEGTRVGWNEGKKAVKTGFRKASTTVGGWLLRAGGETPLPPARSTQP